MELKWGARVRPSLALKRFNRTFMELKSRKEGGKVRVYGVLIVPLWNWNEVFLREIDSGKRFNRTFMELKFASHCQACEVGKVLIVPLWNWNMILILRTVPKQASF